MERVRRPVPHQTKNHRLYLEAGAAEDPGDGRLIRAALNDIARAQNMSLPARDVGTSRAGLYLVCPRRAGPPSVQAESLRHETLSRWALSEVGGGVMKLIVYI